MLSVSIGEGNAEVDAFIDQHDLSYPFLMDRTGEISTTYDVASTPTTFFIATDGTIADTITGVVTRGWLEGNIRRHIVG